MIQLRGEAQVELSGRTLHLAMDNEAWVTVEEILDRPFLDVLNYLIACEEVRDPGNPAKVLRRAKSPKLGTTRAVLFGATREHHPELSLRDCGALITAYSAEIGPALGKAMMGSIRLKDPDQGEAMPAETPANDQDGIGTKS
jgi:hypothetical protein